jgi:hypothetical protein
MEGSVRTNIFIRVAVPMVLMVGPSLLLGAVCAVQVLGWVHTLVAQLPH